MGGMVSHEKHHSRAWQTVRVDFTWCVYACTYVCMFTPQLLQILKNW